MTPTTNSDIAFLMNPASPIEKLRKNPAPGHCERSEAIQKCSLNQCAGLPRGVYALQGARNDKTDIDRNSLKGTSINRHREARSDAAIQKYPLNQGAGLPRFARNDKTEIYRNALKENLEYAHEPFSGDVAWALLPLQGGGWEGDGVHEKATLSAFRPHPHPTPPLEGEGVLQQLKMVHRHNLE